MVNGMADVDGARAVVAGTIVARRDANIEALTAQVRAVLDRERARLPSNVKLVVAYDRSALTKRVQSTLVRAVGEEIAVLALVVLMFLLHIRSAIIPALTLPLVVLLTFAAMRLCGFPATVMSLGGIAIALGMAVDADLVALEACHRRIDAGQLGLSREPRRGALVAAAGSFAPAILTSLVIAALAFLPVFAFGGESGRLLRPLAFTKTLVIGAAALCTLTVAPALRDRLLRGRVVAELDNPLTRILVRAYRPFVHFALSRPMFTLVTAGLAALSCLPLARHLGGEFLPRIDEGALFFMPTTAAGIGPEDASDDLARMDAAIASHPAVAMVFGKVGRADTATDPAPPSMMETTIQLKPRAEWPDLVRKRWYSGWAGPRTRRLLRHLWPETSPATTAELVEALDRRTQLAGWTNAWTAPIRARLDMMSTGVRTEVGVRIVVSEEARLDALGPAVQEAVLRVPGTKSAVYESLGGTTRLDFELDEGALARHKVDPGLARMTAALVVSGGDMGDVEIQERPLARPAASAAATSNSPGQQPTPPPPETGPRLRVPVRMSLVASQPRPLEELLREVTVRSAGNSSGGAGQPVPLALLGRPRFVSVPGQVRTEHGAPVGYVYVTLDQNIDVGTYVERARTAVATALATGAPQLRSGERLEWTGQYELMIAGQRRLMFVAPLVALLMLGLLVLQFRSLSEAAIVLVSVPFALVGSVWTLFLLDYKLSAPVWVGLLSVVGLAMQTGVVMVVYIDDAFFRRLRQGLIRNRADIVDAHAEGTVLRLRPKVMTIVTMVAGLLPLLWADGPGAEVMRRVAAPMIGGLATSAFLTLEVLPVLYTMWRVRQLERADRLGVPLETIVRLPRRAH